MAAGGPERGALQVELALYGGAGEPERPLDGQVRAQRVAAHVGVDGRYGLPGGVADHRAAQVQVAVDLGAGEDQGARQGAVGDDQPPVDLRRVGQEPGQDAPRQGQLTGPGSLEQRRFVETAVGEANRYGDLRETDVQAAREVRAGEPEGGAVAGVVVGVGAQQQGRHDLGPDHRVGG